VNPGAPGDGGGVMEPLLHFRNVSKRYPGFALEDVSFTLPRGYIGGLIGPNGAGKTTIVKLLLNLVRRDAGRIEVGGEDPAEHEVAVKQRIGFVHEVPSYYEHLSLAAIGSMVGGFYPTWDAALYASLLREFDLPPRQRFGSLSRGMRTKGALALALAHRAELLILDEPTAGLDPVFRRALIERLVGYVSDGRSSVLLSTHITSDLERVADFVTYVRAGRVVLSATRDELAGRWATVRGGPALLDAGTRDLLAGFESGPHGVTALTSDAPSLRRRLAGEDAVIEPATLEDIMYYAGRSC
jgi:ABC-2 type transport system ATP-binding protein